LFIDGTLEKPLCFKWKDKACWCYR
jgi:hypothetical protein